jgi:hypothetical protein
MMNHVICGVLWMNTWMFVYLTWVCSYVKILHCAKRKQRLIVLLSDIIVDVLIKKNTLSCNLING